MFLCALARPPYDGCKYFDGKIEIWLIGYEKPAARNSTNTPAGTLEWHSVKVDRMEYREMMICSVLPGIIEKWPTCSVSGPPIYIQQDGAKPHFLIDEQGVCKDREWNLALQEHGLEGQIHIITQPANSPDVNVNYLGFFNSLQSYCWKMTPRNPMELIAMVKKYLRLTHQQN